MPKDIWLILVNPAGEVHTVYVGDPDHDQLVAAENAFRVLLGFPAHDEWIVQPEMGWDLQVTFGEPHPTLRARAIHHELDEVAGVDPQQVAGHIEARAAAVRSKERDAAVAALGRLDPGELDEVLRQHRERHG